MAISPPAEEEEPSENQLAALHRRCIWLKGAPYTDFAIWTPFGRKCQKAQKFRVYYPLGDGSCMMRELPGPQNLLQWLTSWRVYKVACLMLSIASLAALQAYEKTIERLVLQWPKFWGLVYQAEDKGRAERLEKIRRKLMVDFAKNQVMPDDWDQDNPWTTCFRMLSADEEYWNEQVRYPAAARTGAGAKGTPLAPAEQIAITHMPGGLEGVEADKDEGIDISRRRQANRDKRAARAKRLKSDREELDRLRKRPWSAEHKPMESKGKGKGKTKDQAGNPLCFSFASGTGVCGSVEPGGACLEDQTVSQMPVLPLSGAQELGVSKAGLMEDRRGSTFRHQPGTCLGVEKGGETGVRDSVKNRVINHDHCRPPTVLTTLSGLSCGNVVGRLDDLQ